MDPALSSSAALHQHEPPEANPLGYSSQPSRRYGDISVSGSGLTINGDVGTLLQPRSEPEEVAKLGLCLGSAPQIDPADFVGRAADIDEMDRVLQPVKLCQKQRRLVLGGMGGVGKTQLAIAYAERYHSSYDSVFWLNATSQQTLQTSLRLVAGILITATELEALTDNQVRSRVHEWLSNPGNSRWLLIFDNYDEPMQFDIRLYCPYAAHGSIIVTTRLPDFVNLSGDYIRLHPLTDVEESLSILQKRSHRQNAKEDPDARRLAERLGGLPLALTTAGAYLSKRPLTTFQRYLESYEERWNVDPRRPLQLREYEDRTLYTTWDLSYSRLEADDPDAAHMLRLLAYFDNQSIRYEHLRAGTARSCPQELQQLLTDQVDFESAFAVLVEYCFIEVHSMTQSYSLHNCVHDWTLVGLNKTPNNQLYWYAFNCVAEGVGSASGLNRDHLEYAPLALHAARLLHPWFMQAQLLQHIEADLLDDARALAELLLEQAQLVAAEEMFKRILASCEVVLGPDRTRTLELLCRLGGLYFEKGELEEAEPLFKRAVAGFEKRVGLTHPMTLKGIYGLGYVYRYRGKLDEAEQLLQQALDRCEEVLGSNHSSTLDMAEQLGRLYVDQDRIAEAEAMYDRALIGYERELGSDHRSTLNMVGRLGDLYRKQCRQDEAEQMYEREIAGLERVLGSDHGKTLRHKRRLASAYRINGKSSLAETMFQELFPRHEAVFGTDHPSTMSLVAGFGVLRADQGRLEEAERMLRRAVNGFTRRLGRDHPETCDATQHLAWIYRRLGKEEEATALEHGNA